MKILVNALSTTNISGRNVLIGHLARLSSWTKGVHEYCVLYNESNKDICRDLGDNVKWIKCPGLTAGWIGRTVWEIAFLPFLIQDNGVDLFFTPSGTVVTSVRKPQLSYAMNPWCLVAGLHRTPGERIKAYLQRKAYKYAMKKASWMIFLSEYMRQEYRRNAGFLEKNSEVVYTGIDDELFAAARTVTCHEKKPNKVLSVSAMAPHKGVETLVKAIDIVSNKRKVDVQLDIVGGWPNRRYKKKILDIVRDFGLCDAVSFYDHVSRDDLYSHYSEAKVFCLMSRCESFGIPAVEAQAFGTPVISSNCCAIPEVCGAGGVYPDPGDVQGTADQIIRLLTDQEHWKRMSMRAKENAERYHWDTTATRLKKVLDKLSCMDI